MTQSKTTKKTKLTPGEIKGCREALRLSNAKIETHIANALCDMALEALRLHKILLSLEHD